ncbi:hypothetical protein NDS46_04655 [Paenibacillus thiaminolyticus]|uniref:hypothetical protein n=1 Tax=Paenibacillus thiaminolyticus TaxID=49283 RepID=UPI00232CE11E|nr:hypothetical protein [Paenibacillus thiaminolyticus]WCF09201.1 hypothetical protein NDS46_04655 [Paenibacillus thiaminolyticus]
MRRSLKHTGMGPAEYAKRARDDHLSYLIACISADLREKPDNGMMRTASHTLPDSHHRLL